MSDAEPLFNESPISKAMDDAIADQVRAQVPRAHLGFSQIGKTDTRTLWLQFRWCLPVRHAPRVERIFRLGDAIETELARYLEMIPGFNLLRTDEDGRQFRFSLFGDHFAGSMDGACIGVPGAEKTWHVWEAKSVSAKRFGELRTKGVKGWSPEYYAQLQCYMGMSGMDRALFTAYCKDDSEIHFERVRFDAMEWAALQAKALRILEADEPPASSFKGRDWYEAKWMDPVTAAIYWTDRLPPMVNCRNCRHSAPVITAPGADWTCSLAETDIPNDIQPTGCPAHQFLPALFPGELSGDDGNNLHYTLVDGREIVNGPEGYSSHELAEMSKDGFSLAKDEFVVSVRRDMNARLVSQSDPLESRP